MSIYQCLKGHISTEPDYCSECGAKIQDVQEKPLTVNTLACEVETREIVSLQSVIACPDCTVPHDPKSGEFCEICGYNFVTKGHGEVPLGVGEQGSRGAGGAEGVSENDSSLSCLLDIVVIVDPSLRSSESPEPPNQAPITFQLDKESNLIGRRSELRGVYPEVALDFDGAVSQRHALLNRRSDGTFVLRDIGSTNGTKLNGVELMTMVDTPIKDGDEFTLGHWTRIKVKVVRIPGC